MKDSQLFLVVGILLTIDITIMTTWHLADPFYREVQNLKSYVSVHFPREGFKSLCLQFQVNYEKDDTEFIVIPRNENCKSDKMTIFIGVIYAYKGLLLVSGGWSQQAVWAGRGAWSRVLASTWHAARVRHVNTNTSQHLVLANSRHFYHFVSGTNKLAT